MGKRFLKLAYLFNKNCIKKHVNAHNNYLSQIGVWSYGLKRRVKSDILYHILKLKHFPKKSKSTKSITFPNFWKIYEYCIQWAIWSQYIRISIKIFQLFFLNLYLCQSKLVIDMLLANTAFGQSPLKHFSGMVHSVEFLEAEFTLSGIFSDKVEFAWVA